MSMGTRLTREQILAMEDIRTEVVSVPEWDGEVLVRGMTGEERDAWEASMSERRGKRFVPNLANIRAKLVAECCIDDAGNKLFQFADVQLLGRKSSAALDRIYEVAARLSGISQDDVDEMVENFERTLGGGSSSGSPKTGAARSRDSSQRPTPAS